MDPELLLETERLTQSWAHHDEAWLREYLVRGVEDPRLNLQSILSRHFLVRALEGRRFQGLMNEEYRFGAVIDWLRRVARLGEDRDGAEVTLYALQNGRDNAEGQEIPLFVSQAFANLPKQVDSCTIPNYIEQFLHGNKLDQGEDGVINTFVRAWQEAWGAHPPVREPGAPEQSNTAGHSGHMGAGHGPGRLSVLEPACGSANDYRFLARYGIAARIDYTGFDLCRRNIVNARILFPKTRFVEGNVFEIPEPTGSFDLCIVHDLLEHLSLPGMEQAVSEICRATRQGICLGFFQMDEIPDHLVRPLENYHWNLLSMRRMKELFARHGFAAQVIHVSSFLAQQFRWSETHNPNAYTFVLSRQ